MQCLAMRWKTHPSYGIHGGQPLLFWQQLRWHIDVTQYEAGITNSLTATINEWLKSFVWKGILSRCLSSWLLHVHTRVLGGSANIFLLVSQMIIKLFQNCFWYCVLNSWDPYVGLCYVLRLERGNFSTKIFNKVVSRHIQDVLRSLVISLLQIKSSSIKSFAICDGYGSFI